MSRKLVKTSKIIFLDDQKCIECMGCLSICEKEVFRVIGMHVSINEEKAKEACIDCEDHICIKFCPTGAIYFKDV